MESVCYLQVPGHEQRIPSGSSSFLSYNCRNISGKGIPTNNNSTTQFTYGKCGCDSSVINNNCPHHSNNSSNGNNSNNDKYLAAIELSNKCREFYNSRLQAANSIKSRWHINDHQDPAENSSLSSSSSSSSSSASSSCSSSQSSSPTNDIVNANECRRGSINSIDRAMDRLRNEMVSLMEQDLSLMKQLLTLNESIEELKQQRQYYCSSRANSCTTSCASLSQYPTGGAEASTWSVSDTEMYDSEDDLLNQSDSEAAMTCDAPSGTVDQTPLDHTASIPVLKVSHSCVPHSLGVSFANPAQRDAPSKLQESPIVDDRLSLDSLSAKLENVGLEEGGLTAAVMAALRKRCDSSASHPEQVEDVKDVEFDNSTSGGYGLVSNRSLHKVVSSHAGPNECLGLSPGPIVKHDRDQHSFDSGIHEPAFSEEIVWNV